MATGSGEVFIHNFGGGLNKSVQDGIASNEASSLKGWMTVEGKLRSMDGRASGRFGLTTATLANVTEWVLFYPSGVAYHLLRSTNPAFLFYDTFEDTTDRYRPVASVSASEGDLTAAAWGDYLYYSTTASTGRVKRFEPFVLWGTVTCNGTTTISAFSGSYANLRKGDSFFVKNGTAWKGPYYILDWDAGAGTITVNTATDIPTGTGISCSISRIHNAGIAPIDAFTGTPALTPVAAGGSFVAGDYMVALTLYNENTGYESPAYYIGSAATVAASGELTIGSYDTSPDDYGGWQATHLRIYMTAVGGTLVYYLRAEVARDQAGYTFPASYTLDGTETEGAILTNNRGLPPSGAKIKQLGNRIVAYAPTGVWTTGSTWASTGRNEYDLSTLNAAEYFPRWQIGVEDPLQVDEPETAGGYFTIGSADCEIMDVTPEIGSGAIGRDGAGVFVLKRFGPTYHIYGTDWLSWRIEEGFASEAVSCFTGAQRDGRMFWVGRNGPMMAVAGSVSPEPIYTTMFPSVSQPFTSRVTQGTYATDYMRLIRGVIWRDFYVVAWPETPSTVNNRVMMYHIPTGRWMTMPENDTYPARFSCFGIQQSPGEPHRFYAADGTGGELWNLFTNGTLVVGADTYEQTYWTGSLTVGVDAEYIGPEFWGDPKHEHLMKQVTAMWVLVEKTYETQTISVSMLMDGEETGTAISHATTADPTGTQWLKYVPHDINWEGFSFQPKITGTFTMPVTIRAYLIKYDVIGDQPNI